VQEPGWRGIGPHFTLNWGGRDWTLKVDTPSPGLIAEGATEIPRVLSLDRLAAPGRSDPEAFCANTLVEVERYRGAVRATFAPPAWGGLRVRASWSFAGQDAVDLEVQLSATSVGELDGLEVGVVTCLRPLPGDRAAVPVEFVEARDPSAALLSSDGRDPAPALRQFTIHSRARPLRPYLCPAPWAPGDLFYAELIHPDDVARRILVEPVPHGRTTVNGGSTRYGLFGLALEKGVILRARLRGCWFHSAIPDEVVTALYQQFLQEPPPLGP
jgi:hypothetical protein